MVELAAAVVARDDHLRVVFVRSPASRNQRIRGDTRRGQVDDLLVARFVHHLHAFLSYVSFRFVQAFLSGLLLLDWWDKNVGTGNNTPLPINPEVRFKVCTLRRITMVLLLCTFPTREHRFSFFVCTSRLLCVLHTYCST